jgi:pSer/pThr/pTyr-binding forkhead associated (FHA) protein
LPSDFNPQNDFDDGTQRLKIKIFGGPSAGEVFFFRASTKPLIVGRTPECDIMINDKLLSKCQSHIKYVSQVDQWVMCDGYQSKASTNGTWLYLNEDHLMSSGMVFKAN